MTLLESGIIYISKGPNFHISHCNFQYNKNSSALKKLGDNFRVKYEITITNTVFASSTPIINKGFLYLQSTNLHLQGPVLLYNVSYVDSLIYVEIRSFKQVFKGTSWGLLGALPGWGPGQNAPVAPPVDKPH